MRIPLLAMLFVLFFSGLQAKDPAAPFTVTVVPSSSSAEGQSVKFADESPEEFFVILTNVTKEVQSVFEYWNSWGYQAISFEITMPDGRKIVASRSSQSFRRNVLASFFVRPGEQQVFAIRVDKRWETHPAMGRNTFAPITLKAIYEVRPSDAAAKLKVWTGRVESKEYHFNLWKM